MYKQKHTLQFIDLHPDGPHIFLTLSICDEFTFKNLTYMINHLFPDDIKIIKRNEERENV